MLNGEGERKPKPPRINCFRLLSGPRLLKAQMSGEKKFVFTEAFLRVVRW